jgi:hypothetical protein
MGTDATADFFKMLGNFPPGWILLNVVAIILSYRSPQIIRELFAGVRRARSKRKKDK